MFAANNYLDYYLDQPGLWSFSKTQAEPEAKSQAKSQANKE
jgi:hypothetical protein